jgi:hypothetical protein
MKMVGANVLGLIVLGLSAEAFGTAVRSVDPSPPLRPNLESRDLGGSAARKQVTQATPADHAAHVRMKAPGTRTPSPEASSSNSSPDSQTANPYCCAECDEVEESVRKTMRGLSSPPPSGRRSQWQFKLTAEDLESPWGSEKSIRRVASSCFA